MLEMAEMLEVLPLGFFASVAALSLMSLVLEDMEELQPALSPAPVHLSWIIDKDNSFLGKVSFFTILMISYSFAVDSQSLSPMCSVFSASAHHPSPQHLPKSCCPLVEYLPFFMT